MSQGFGFGFRFYDVFGRRRPGGAPDRRILTEDGLGFTTEDGEQLVLEDAEDEQPELR